MACWPTWPRATSRDLALVRLALIERTCKPELLVWQRTRTLRWSFATSITIRIAVFVAGALAFLASIGPLLARFETRSPLLKSLVRLTGYVLRCIGSAAVAFRRP